LDLSFKPISEQGRKALWRVASWLENGAPHVRISEELEVSRFDMGESVTTDDDCGTSCCIAGAICQFEQLGMDARLADGSMYWSSYSRPGVRDLVIKHLGINETKGSQLFEPWLFFPGTSESFNSPARGAAVIRHFLATGVVDWMRYDDEGKQ
jgi:hypothetical protein